LYGIDLIDLRALAIKGFRARVSRRIAFFNLSQPIRSSGPARAALLGHCQHAQTYGSDDAEQRSFVHRTLHLTRLFLRFLRPSMKQIERFDRR
jgi:hypothetical protein